MSTIQTGELPSNALLRQYQEKGAFTDCYFTDVPGVVEHARFVEAFYTTPVFKLERFILRWAIRRPSSDAEARDLAAGTRDRFAAWTVEARAPNQLLMCDVMGRTRSWLMCAESPTAGPTHTRLYFGSAVVPPRVGASGQRRLNWVFRSLMGFHQLYSRVLLRAAVSRWQDTPPPSPGEPP